jgi:hypothetical protein
VIVELRVDMVATPHDVLPVAVAAVGVGDHLRVQVGIRLNWKQRVLIAVQRDRRVLDVAGVGDRADARSQRRRAVDAVVERILSATAFRLSTC